jgi:uncharacterized membrane protein/glutaredoxin-related protein
MTSRPTPWMHRWSRPLIGAIALLGMLDTATITYEKLNAAQGSLCQAGCSTVLNSPYASVLGYPLALFGLLAYGVMALLALVPLAIDQEGKPDGAIAQTWTLLFWGAMAMVVFSGYLMYLLVVEIQAVCYFCIASAVFSSLLLLLTLVGRKWEDWGQTVFSGAIVIMVTLVGTLGIFSPVAQSMIPGTKIGDAAGNVFFVVDTESGESEAALAKHLKESGATMYGAYWCPHCCEQKQLFGQTAMKDLNYVECADSGKNSNSLLCKTIAPEVEAQTQENFGFPTWKIGDRYYPGRKTLPELAKLTGYTGPQEFQNGFQICKTP